MGASKSSKVIKNFLGKKKNNGKDSKVPTQSEDSKVIPGDAHTQVELENSSVDQSPEEDIYSSDQPTTSSEQPKSKKSKKTTKKQKKQTGQKHAFTNHTISNLSRALGPNDWIRLAYALGFLPKGIAHFTGRASSAQNSYSQCTFMLKTWRALTSPDEILPRLCNALQKIRRHDLAMKIGLELAIQAIPQRTEKKDPMLFPDLLKLMNENNDTLVPPYDESKIVFTDDKVSFLARQLLAREEWKRLAYALGFLPDDASQIIASASSSQNLYAQAHMMLIKWRNKTPPSRIIRSLRAAFIRIRRHDLVFLLDLGVIAPPADGNSETLEEKLRKLEEETKDTKTGFGAEIASKFKDLQL